MQVTETSTEGLRRAFKVVVESADIEKSIVARLTDIGKQVKLPGFRPGKVPTKILRTPRGRYLTLATVTRSSNPAACKPILNTRWNVRTGF